jgi:undecaprenyl-diphosphatase
MTTVPLLARLDDRDRALFGRWSLAMHVAPARRHILLWQVITHCGGAHVSVIAALLPLILSNPSAALHSAAGDAALGLALSHLIIQIVKKHVGRPRPSRRTGCVSLVSEPACFSFPSGHAAASMSVAFAYAAAFPASALPLILCASVVGFSRVRLGVHYPGDVLAGQLIAVGTDLALRALW